MSQDYWQVQNNPKVHEGPVELDEAIISREISLTDAGANLFLTSPLGFPADAVVKGCEGYGKSNWNTSARVDLDIHGSPLSYFLKASFLSPDQPWIATHQLCSGGRGLTPNPCSKASSSP